MMLCDIVHSSNMAQYCGSLEVAAMCAHVTIQIPTLREAGITDLALVRLLTCMSAKVLSEGGAISKSFAAGSALVRSVSRVRPHVRGDGTAL